MRGYHADSPVVRPAGRAYLRVTAQAYALYVYALPTAPKISSSATLWTHRQVASRISDMGLVSSIPWAAVEPECPGFYRGDPQQSGQRPGILSKACPDLVLICGLNDVQGLLAIADRTAEDDEAIIDKPVHEGRMLIPGVLIPDLTRTVPA